MGNISGQDELVTKKDLADFYKFLLPYLGGGTSEILANKFSKCDIYSTDEKIIGQWIDGKPVYQKTIDCGTLPNATTKTISMGSNIERVINIHGCCYNSSGYNVMLPFLRVPVTQGNGSIAIMNIRPSLGTFDITSESDRSDYTESYVTLQYTKTTDSSIAIGIDTDYSTNEKIIGTWIDGKPIYQKTIVGKTPTSTGINVNIADVTSWNIDQVISFDGCFTLVGPARIPINYYYSAENYAMTHINDHNQLTMIIGFAEHTNKDVYITVKYTKTTD